MMKCLARSAILSLAALVVVSSIRADSIDGEESSPRSLENGPLLDPLEDAVRLEQHANHLLWNSRYEQAEPLLLMALMIRKAVLGEQHPDYANVLAKLGVVYLNRDLYEQAEVHYRQARSILKPVLMKHNPNSVVNIGDFSRLHRALSKNVFGSYISANDDFVFATNIFPDPDYSFTFPDAADLETDVDLMMKQGDWQGAGLKLKLLLNLHRSNFGEMHPNALYILDNFVRLYENMKEYELAAKYLLQALAIRKMMLGEQHPHYVRNVDKLAWLYEEMVNSGIRNTEVLERNLLQALAIRRATVGERHPSYVRSLYALAVTYEKQENYLEAEPLHQQVLAMRKVTLGEEHPDYVASLNHLADLYFRMEYYEQAESLYQRVLAIRKTTFGEEHPHYVSDLEKLAFLYTEMEAYAASETLYQQARAIRKATQGEEHPDHVTTMDYLANLYIDMANYEQAEALYKQVLEIRKRVQGEDHPDYVVSLNRLADLYVSMENYEQAEALYKQALDAVYRHVLGIEWVQGAEALYKQALDAVYKHGLEIEWVQGEGHPNHVVSLNHLANLYVSMENYEQAEALYKQVLEIEWVQGEGHPNYVVSLNHLANLYVSMENYEQAEALYKQALEIRKRVQREEDPQYVATLEFLAALYQRMGEYFAAGRYIQEALALRQAMQGEQHSAYVRSLRNLTELYVDMGAHKLAKPLYRQVLGIYRTMLDRMAVVQSEREQLATGERLRSALDGYLSIAIDTGDSSYAAFEEILLWKGATLVRQRQYRQAASDPAVSELFKKLQGVTRQLASLARAYPEQSEEVAGWRERLNALNADRERLEVTLSGASAAFRQAQETVTVAEVAEALPDGAMLVDYLEFTKYADNQSTRSLLASVLRQDGTVTVFDLGPQEPVAEAIEMWRQTYGRSEHGMEAGQQLRKTLWDPLLSALGETKTLLVSLDGALGRLPLGALPGAQPDTYLLEEYELSFLPVPQLLPALVATHQQEAARGLLLVGDLDYDARQTERDSSVAPAPRSWRRNHNRAVAEVRGGVYFESLENTAGEILRIEDLFKSVFHPSEEAVELLRHADATEQRFRTLAPQFYHLHLATHGFFAPPQHKVDQGPGQRSGVYDGRGAAVVHGTDPGLLSGLVLSGANQPPQPEQDDGILTATEISFLPLAGAHLVTLSACETGLGATAGGEGLLGVQRAFQVAGARSTVASLWNVPDLATRLLMERFYRHLWEEEMSAADALRAAQLWLLKNPEVLRGLIASNSPSTRSSPQYWAAFQLSGDWR